MLEGGHEARPYGITATNGIGAPGIGGMSRTGAVRVARYP
jgi:hypothetical protein